MEWDRYLKSVLTVSPEEEVARDLGEKVADVRREFAPKRIYFGPSTAAEVERLLDLLGHVGLQFSSVTYRDPATGERVVAEEVVERWKNCVVSVQELLPSIEQEFRVLLRGE